MAANQPHFATLKRRWWKPRKVLPEITPEERARLIAEWLERYGVTRCPCQYRPVP